ncbi:unnamed protein product [Brassicogethes aeneus]|uniref:GH16 domain-containing protein n=1 Tax=Brassicogethes aeneus TaxID=1431903 RepID=A0A9P0FB57_BRAAE|nr:unnamed protein product [Brassicogethes aeneus]
MKLEILILSLFAIYVRSKSVDLCGTSLTTVSGTHAPKQVCAGELIFEDDFDTLDLKKWQHELTLGGGGNWEFQYYNNNRTNSYVENGILHIKPTLLADEKGEAFLTSGTLEIYGGSPQDQCTNPLFYGCSRTGSPVNILNPIKSARIRTINSFAFTYGKVEVRAKIPAGDWLWPAIWLMPKWFQYSLWPASGEIDIMESRGNRDLISSENGQNIGTKLVGSTLHFGPNTDYNRYMHAHYEKTLQEGYDAAFHNYQLNWTPDGITFSIDDEVIGEVRPTDQGFWNLGELDKTNLENPWKGGSKMAPFDEEFYLILNLAVGGTTYFPDTVTNPGGKPWSNTSPKAATDFWNGRNQWLPTWKNDGSTHFQVDYVRVWAV